MFLVGEWIICYLCGSFFLIQTCAEIRVELYATPMCSSASVFMLVFLFENRKSWYDTFNHHHTTKNNTPKLITCWKIEYRNKYIFKETNTWRIGCVWRAIQSPYLIVFNSCFTWLCPIQNKIPYICIKTREIHSGSEEYVSV